MSFEDKKEPEEGAATVEFPAKISEELRRELEELAKRAWEVFGCEGLTRVDFMYDVDQGKVFLNELTTVPGLTDISHFPLLWEKSGVGSDEMFKELMENACRR